jgi:hypothetical protein
MQDRMGKHHFEKSIVKSVMAKFSTLCYVSQKVKVKALHEKCRIYIENVTQNIALLVKVSLCLTNCLKLNFNQLKIIDGAQS